MSTDSGVVAKQPEGSSAAVARSGQLVTPAVSSAGVVPDAPSSEAPDATAPGAKPATPEAAPAAPVLPYLGWLDLGVEDKARFFDRIAGVVSQFLCDYSLEGFVL